MYPSSATWKCLASLVKKKQNKRGAGYASPSPTRSSFRLASAASEGFYCRCVVSPLFQALVVQLARANSRYITATNGPHPPCSTTPAPCYSQTQEAHFGSFPLVRLGAGKHGTVGPREVLLKSTVDPNHPELLKLSLISVIIIFFKKVIQHFF